MAMWMTIKMNNETIMTDVQGALVDTISDYLEETRGTELGYETVEINASSLAQYITANHDIVIEHDNCEFTEADNLYYESDRVFGEETGFTPRELKAGLNDGTILFGRPITPETTLTVIVD